MDSFSQLYRELHPKILRYMNRLVGRESADDLTQEVFLRALRGLESFEGRASPATWLYRIASNVAIDFYRSASFRHRRSEASLPDAGESGILSALMAQEPAAVVDDEMLRCVREFVDSLPEDYRTAFVLHEMEGYSNAEVAEILGTSIPTAKIRIHRAKMRLKKKMESGCCLYYDEENRLSCSRKL